MWFEEEEILRAKHINVVEVMTALGCTMKPWSGNQYYWEKHDSFKAKDFLWYWNSRTMGGNAVDLLIKCFDYTFVDAVRILLEMEKGHSIQWQATKQQPQKQQPQMEQEKPTVNLPFQIPIKNKSNERVLSYLCKIRGLSEKIVQQYIADGYIYEEKKTHNAIFIGKNSKQEICYAFRRGTIGKKFAGDVAGSDKRYAFAANADSKTDTIYLFEAAIDALSYLTLHPNCKDRCQTLAGASLLSFKEALKQSDIKNILIATDNDQTGERIYQNILTMYGNQNDDNKQNYNIQRLRPTQKDVNADLLSVCR